MVVGLLILAAILLIVGLVTVFKWLLILALGFALAALFVWLFYRRRGVRGTNATY